VRRNTLSNPSPAQRVERDAGRVTLRLRNDVSGKEREWTYPAGTELRIVPGPQRNTEVSPARQIEATVPIEHIAAGMAVVSRDERSGATTLRRVKQAFQRTAEQLVTVDLADPRIGQVVETITATPEHPFYVQGQGFEPLGSLGIGTSIITRAGPPFVVRSIDWQEHPQGVPIYNFEFETDHSYLVGGTAAGGAWVHNASCGDPFEDAMGIPRPGSLPDRIRRALAPGDARSPGEKATTRNYFKRNRGLAREWWMKRSGNQKWPAKAVHDSHPRALADGGDPLFIEPSFLRSGPGACRARGLHSLGEPRRTV
jgi:hypothetical protein